MTETLTAPTTVTERPLPVFTAGLDPDRYTQIQNYLTELGEKVLHDSARPSLCVIKAGAFRTEDRFDFEVLEDHWKWFLNMRDSIRNVSSKSVFDDEELAGIEVRSAALSKLSATWNRWAQRYIWDLMPSTDGYHSDDESSATFVLKELAAMQYPDELPDGAFSMGCLLQSLSFKDDYTADALTLALNELVEKGWLRSVDGWWEIPHADLSAQVRMHNL